MPPKKACFHGSVFRRKRSADRSLLALKESLKISLFDF